MATLQSVGVQVTETDLTPVTQPVSASIGAYVGHFNWGPVNQIINVSSERALGEIFGVPRKSGDLTAASFLTAESFLKYGNALKVIRACSNALAKNSASTLADAYFISNSDEFDQLTTLTSLFYARYPGELGNSLKVQIFHKGNTTTDPLKAECKKFFSILPDTTIWASTLSSTAYVSDEVHVIIYDEDGEISGTKGTVLETWQGLSLNANARNTNGTANYWKDVINTGSQYLYVEDTTEAATLAEQTKTYTLTGTGAYSLVGGVSATPDKATVVTTLNLLKDVDNIDINLIFAEAFANDTTYTVNTALSSVVAARGDSMAFLSAPVNLYTESNDTEKLNALKDAKAGISQTNTILSYTVFDSTPVYVYNRYSDSYEWIPACGHLAGLCAYTDEVSDPWFSPAGFNRGQLRGVVKLAYNPTTVDRDELYNSNINPIVNISGQGIILYGDKTGQTRPSAFDRINVRRLFIAVQRVCALAAKYQLFELNDEFTRNAFINTIDPYLRDVQGRRGITDYRVVCNETNNTPQVIDSNRFVADIYIKPARSINYISLNFIATRTGISFTEIGA